MKYQFSQHTQLNIFAHFARADTQYNITEEYVLPVLKEKERKHNTQP